MEELIQYIVTDLRERLGESIYRTAKDSGLRAETIKKLEEVRQGSAESLIKYIDSYIARYPSRAYKLYYNMAIKIAQKQELK